MVRAVTDLCRRHMLDYASSSCRVVHGNDVLVLLNCAGKLK